jgi:hypothetical protein
MVKRVAVIIGSNDAVSPPLTGVDADHQNYRSFLTSSAGGAWRDDEIFSIKGAVSADDLMAALAGLANVDFALTVFTGHGFGDEDTGLSYVCLNEDECVPVLDLVTGCPRQLIIADSCRTFLIAADLRKGERVVLGETIDRRAEARYRASCRQLYDRAIMVADASSPQFMYASAIDQPAGDSRRGGLFSTMLLGQATAWAQDARIQGQDAHTILSTYKAHRRASREIARRRYDQHPQGDWGQRSLHLPFAVA